MLGLSRRGEREALTAHLVELLGMDTKEDAGRRKSGGKGLPRSKSGRYLTHGEVSKAVIHLSDVERGRGSG